MKRAVTLAAATCLYLLGAWMVAPGFYDGFTPVCDYIWSSPPPQAPTSSLRPKGGHITLNVTGGVSDAASLWTEDVEEIGGLSTPCPQLIVGFGPGVFDSRGARTVSVELTPDPTLSAGPGLRFVTNVYRVTADAPLVKSASIELVFSNLLPPPSFVYFSNGPGDPWKSIGGQDSQPYTFVTSATELGYFAAGYSSAGGTGPGPSTNQLLPVVVATFIVAVLLAGIPLSVIRRRRGGDLPGE
jgi:hypothetical protein